MQRGLAVNVIGSEISIASAMRKKIALQKRHERSEELWKKLKQELLENYNRKHEEEAVN